MKMHRTRERPRKTPQLDPLSLTSSIFLQKTSVAVKWVRELWEIRASRRINRGESENVAQVNLHVFKGFQAITSYSKLAQF